jgi:3-hydroxyacyl-CoA dehydrogenase
MLPEIGSTYIGLSREAAIEYTKHGIRINIVCPGVLASRILLAYISEALLSVQKGISPEKIAREAKRAGFQMGPVELSDMIGWNMDLHIFPMLHEAYGVRFPLS